MSLPPSIEVIVRSFNWTTDGGVVQLCERVAAEASKLKHKEEAAQIVSLIHERETYRRAWNRSDEQLAACRADALEEAAKMCDYDIWLGGEPGTVAPRKLAAAIRAAAIRASRQRRGKP